MGTATGRPETQVRCRQVREDVFALPAPTTARFALLIAAVLGSSLFSYDFLFIAINGAASIGHVPYERGRPVAMLAGVVLVVVVAVAIYLYYPRLIIRRGRLVPLNAADAADLVRCLTDLVAEARLNRSPRFLLDPLNAAPGGLAFGHRGRYRVRLNGGLVVLFATDPPAFRAVVRHELAHVRNRDIDKTYLTIAMWQAFLVVALLPLGVSLALTARTHLLAVGWRAAILAALVYLTRNAVLRVREMYADLRADGYADHDPALRRLLVALPQPRRRWSALLRTHPDPAARLRAVRSPEGLLRPGRWEAFGAGVAATVAFDNVSRLLVLAYGPLHGLPARWITASVFASLAIGVVGLGVWRATLHWQQHGTTRSPGALLPALCLAAGMLLGTTLSLDGALSGSSGIFGVPGLALGPVGIVVLVAGVVLVLEWTALVARVWLPTVGPRLRTTVCGLGLAAAAFVFAVFLGVWFLFYDLQPLISALSTRSEASYAETSRVAWTGPYWLWAGVEHDLTALLIHENLIATALILLWLVPQSAWLRRPSRPPTGTPATPRPSRRLRAWSVYTTASLGSLAYLAATLLLRAVTHADIPAEVLQQPDFAIAFTYWLVALAILAQVAVAFTVAATIGRSGVASALYAAFLTGIAAFMILLGGIILGRCVEGFGLGGSTCGWHFTSPFVDLILRQVLIQGALAAVPAALLGWLIGAAARRLAAGSRLARHR